MDLSATGDQASTSYDHENSGWSTVGRDGRPRNRESPETKSKRAKFNDADRPPLRRNSGDSENNYDKRCHEQIRYDRQTSVIRENLGIHPVEVTDRFVVIIQPKDRNKPFHKVDPFKLKRTLIALVKPKEVKYLAQGGLVVIVSEKEDADILFQTQMIGDIEVSASSPKIENVCKGVVRNLAANNKLCEEIKAELEEDNLSVKVVNVNRLGADKSNTYCVTFEGKDLPNYIYHGYWRHSVSPFFSSPLQCFKCQKFGHYSALCRGTVRCLHCAGPHSHKMCDKERRKLPPTCCNCRGDHPSFSGKCPAKRVQVRINKTKARDNISFSQAKAKIMVPGASWADILAGRAVQAPRAKQSRPPPETRPTPSQMCPSPPPPSAVRLSASLSAPLPSPPAAHKPTLDKKALLSLVQLIVGFNDPDVEFESAVGDLKRAAENLGVPISDEDVQSLFYTMDD